MQNSRGIVLEKATPNSASQPRSQSNQQQYPRKQGYPSKPVKIAPTIVAPSSSVPSTPPATPFSSFSSAVSTTSTVSAAAACLFKSREFSSLTPASAYQAPPYRQEHVQYQPIANAPYVPRPAVNLQAAQDALAVKQETRKAPGYNFQGRPWGQSQGGPEKQLDQD